MLHTAISLAFREAREIKYIWDDGGLSEAPLSIRNDHSIGGMTDEGRGDCVVRSLAIGLDRPYEVIWEFLHDWRVAMEDNCSFPKHGVGESEYLPLLHKEGWRKLRLGRFDEGITVKDVVLKLEATPNISCILLTSDPSHLTAIRNGVLRDTWNCEDIEVFSLYGRIEDATTLRENLSGLTTYVRPRELTI